MVVLLTNLARDCPPTWRAGLHMKAILDGVLLLPFPVIGVPAVVLVSIQAVQVRL